MTNKEVLSIFQTRHSTREYLDKMVSQEDIETVLEAANLAPKGMNRKASHFYVFKKGEEKYQKLVDFAIKQIGDNPFYDAPVIILATIDTSIAVTPIQDSSVAMENMLLAGCLLGLGTCWINSVSFFFNQKNLDFLASLGVNKNYKVVASCILGYKK